MEKYFYKIYGKTVCSELYFPQLVVVPAVADADIYIRGGVIADEIKALEGEKYWEIGDTFSWLCNKTCWFTVEDGKTITYELKDGMDEAKMGSYLLGYGMSMLHLQRGEMAIHCSALVKDDKAILVAGRSGSGKSTTTALLLEAGFSLMADDVAVVKVEDGKVICYPAFPYQKLCRDVVEQGDYDMQKLIYINEQKDKFLVPYEGEFSTEGKEVCAFFCLGKRKDSDELYMEEITGISKLHYCVENLFMVGLVWANRYSPKIGSKCLEIASKVRMYAILRPEEADTLRERVDFIVEQWKNS